HVIRTADELAEALAHLARGIRDAARTLMEHESERGPLRKLHHAFQTTLIHDLTEDGFADTYAQTITYGLLIAALQRTDLSGGKEATYVKADDLTGIVRVTSPFIREMLETFLKVGGRKGGIDFDELGVQDVVELLRGESTDLPAILRDFGNKTRGEDPVIHFYEHFLTAYNKQLKIQRGVFYTPQPVVSYIVRSVHELLQTEFGLEDGLASTITWGEMLKKFPDLKLPPLTDEPGETRTISPDEPFVQILDIATGTGTFVAEVIEIIHQTMLAKWKKAGMTAAQVQQAWNEYVPRHLLPRVYGFELMMSAYVIAHLKVGLKLSATGFNAWSQLDPDKDRVRIYLTNTLEPPDDRQAKLIGFDALAHEAAAVNEIKRHKRFTVVIGNPPYSRVSQNQSAFIQKLMKDYKEPVADEANQQPLDDDYIKCLRLAHHLQSTTKCGIIGFITNHTVISGILFRGVRQRLLEDQNLVAVVDLHGNSNIKEKCADGSKDENVFDIQAGVAVTIGAKAPWLEPLRCVFHELWGLRTDKYAALMRLSVAQVRHVLAPAAPYFFLKPIDLSAGDELKGAFSLPDIFRSYSSGLMTVRDNLAIAFDRDELRERFEMFRSSAVSDTQFQAVCPVKDYRKWSMSEARRNVRADKKWEKRMEVVNYGVSLG
ncbi:MAG: type ISP restriction/modification enzyme, partial [Verrucomicrobiales bacterium]